MSSNRLWMRAALLSVLAGAVLVGIGIGLGGTYYDGYGIHLGMHEENDYHSIELQAFSDLDVDLEYGDIQIQQGDEWRLIAENLPEDQYHLEQTDDKLTLKTYQDSNFSLIHLGIMESPAHVTLIVPKDCELSQVTIHSALGDVELEDFKADTVDVEQAMGDIRISDVWTETMNLEQAMGDVTYDGEHPGNLNVDNAMGDIEVIIEDSKDQYRYECTTAMGSIKAAGQKEGGPSAKLQAGSADAPYHLRLDNDMGDIELEFENDWD